MLVQNLPSKSHAAAESFVGCARILENTASEFQIDRSNFITLESY